MVFEQPSTTTSSQRNTVASGYFALKTQTPCAVFSALLPLNSPAVCLQSRYVPGAVDGIRSALTWAGLSYDFGKVGSRLCTQNSDGHTFIEKALVWVVHMARIIRYVLIVYSIVLSTDVLAVRTSRLVSLVRTSARGSTRYPCYSDFPLSYSCSQVTHTAVSAPQINSLLQGRG